ncbi:elongation factor TS-domain-containing protein [Dunaliella salina]|uniref:Elongation factor Ts, mitochondrial n=1 Tax=Dunaliella salina TaxID=3046 RepID=A0ABQ7GJE2_DUNSA|nr:elongation factor TS-domain-containing protein [Dunaliella salina]|eukprot:KAF5834737.1 elongation factor TS-domain-containing protein [Dunaliella salina]
MRFAMRALAAAGPLLRGFASSSEHASLIKQLRVMSGAPISDVKACLEASGWDLDGAYNGLRQKGMAAAVKKASRHASEGLVGLATAGPQSATIVEVNCETDFVARNELFQGLVLKLAQAAMSVPARSGRYHELELEKVMKAPTSSGSSVSEACAEVAGQVRENVRIRRAFRVKTTTGLISSYIHQSLCPGLGRIASLVLLEPKSRIPLRQENWEKVDKVGQQLAMHVAGMRPLYLHRKLIPDEIVDHERMTIRHQASSSGKPAKVVNSIVQGRLEKYFAEHVLVDQPFIADDSVQVKDVVHSLSKDIETRLTIPFYLRVQCGEGLDAARTDFAEEVSSLTQEHMSQ